MLVDGNIAKWGTYKKHMSNNGTFTHFINEFVSKSEDKEAENKAVALEDKDKEAKETHCNAVPGATMMQAEGHSTTSGVGGVIESYDSSVKLLVHRISFVWWQGRFGFLIHPDCH